MCKIVYPCIHVGTLQNKSTHLRSLTEPVLVGLLRCPGNDSQPGGPLRHPYLTYKPARLHRLAESIPWNRFLGSFVGNETFRKIPRNRLGMVSVIPRKKVLIPGHSKVHGRVNSKTRNETERKYAEKISFKKQPK
jgi:hypothetical protein